ncbi:MAG TPA: SsrA-binding protein [Saprospirales bacterium]|jgi:SsrA-binding protein|nr:SsrA-binding protein SmpB [Saprospiraceae bacterium]HAV30055.1 SsrA-binding protein [Saprospirales bacterium]MDA9182341.1 SsrA-binding protein SmpB [Saprospiraceae bacterium]MDA9263479.1 SsrA-binding protein SmpB [Saprospiraceae bacterium]MDA9299264.1 SsrA-binding protein SmpB [Saprospiraceae bacterium]|tara:strand:+ start:1886 stop:2350 length:465 start_codon:yes stop_codon:yes gene_type:complete
MAKQTDTPVIVNRKAKYEYTLVDEFEAGIMLKGTEVKAMRSGNANLSDAYCIFDNGNLIIKSMFIAEYDHGNVNNHETRADRRLLLRKSELKKIKRKLDEKGLTLVPYKIYFTERGFVKLNIWLAQGKKSFDKRNSIKEKDVKRELDREMKKFK